jgi:hypothetical protein
VYNRSLLRGIYVSLLLVCCGCGEKSYPLAKVSGKITKGGQPVPGASILFQPMATSADGSAGPGSFGISDAEGRYELKTYKLKTEGAVVGRHRVTINLPLPPGIPDDGAVDPSLMSPMRFRDGSLQIEVPQKGLESADFELNEK